jgi:hypothetical protein
MDTVASRVTARTLSIVHCRLPSAAECCCETTCYRCELLTLPSQTAGTRTHLEPVRSSSSSPPSAQIEGIMQEDDSLSIGVLVAVIIKQP